MNERIKQLSDIAYKNHLENNPESSFGRRTDYDKEFAELIVRECADIFAQEGTGRYEVDGNWIAKTIKQHFGVEEQKKVAPKPRCSVWHN